MQYVGRPSWSLNISGPASVLDHALYVRDAADLAVDALSTPQDRLVAPDVRISRRLSRAQSSLAAQQWEAWWRACTGLTVLRTLPDGPLIDGTWHEDLNAAAARAGEAPQWSALADTPELQQAVLLAQIPYDRWRHEQKVAASRTIGEAPRHGVEHRELVSLAERVIREHGVSPDRVRARVLYLSAPGRWWSRAWPGVVVATTAALADADSFAELVEDGFVSGL